MTYLFLIVRGNRECAIMSPVLQELQLKKIMLENELQALNEKERVLVQKIKLLETTNYHDIKPSELEEKDSQSKKYPNDSNAAQIWAQKPKRNETTNRTALTSQNGSKLNRVHLKGNVVFSWSYQQLS